MAELESVVRPNQTPNYAPEQRFVPGGQKSGDPILLTIGRSGQGKTFNGSFNAKTSFYCEAAENEFMGPHVPFGSSAPPTGG